MSEKQIQKFRSPAFWALFFACFIGLVFILLHFSSKHSKTPETLHILLQRSAENSQDFYVVEEELNQYLSKIEDFQVQFRIVDETSRKNNFIQNLKSEEPIDLLFSDKDEMDAAVFQNLLEPLDSLLENLAPEILDVLNKDYLDTGYIEESRYGLPSIRDYSSSACFEYDIQLANQYDLKMDSVKTLDDLEEELLKLKQAAPSVIPVGINLYIGVAALLKIDILGDNYSAPLAVLKNYGQTSQVVNLYETPEFTAFVNQMYAWRKKGLLMDDTGASMSAINYLKTHKVFGCFSNYHPGFDIEETRGSGTPIGCVILGNYYISSFNAQRHFWEIPSKSKEKENAMRFLKLMYTDKNVVQILSYGKEGIHYEYKDSAKQIIGYPEEINVDNSRYSQFLGWRYGNEMLMPVWEGLPQDLWKQITDYNDSSIRSIAIGFSFHKTPVADEISDCTAIAQKYYPGLINGELDPARYLPIVRKELQDAGISTIVAQKQKQLNDYLKGEKES